MIATTLAVAVPVDASVTKSAGKTYSVTATVKGGQNLSVLLVSASGQTLASTRVTRSNQKVTLKSSRVSTAAGATLQLVSTAGTAKGEYFGPVVLGWKGKRSTSASKVYTKLRQPSTKVSLGTMTIKRVAGSAKQGYAVLSTASKLADASTASQVSASKGRPKGVGTYGKTKSVASTEYGVSVAGFVEVPNPPNPNPNPQQPGQQPAQPQNQQPNQQTNLGDVAKDNTLGGDKDDDGIPNAFDVDDDGDGKEDSSDADTPTPAAAANDGTKDCSAVAWRIFTNFKATQPNYQGTINAYGTGNFEATQATIADAITKTMSMVFAPVTQVCGSNVTATYIKGNGAAYAPADYVALGKTCSTGDYQWLIGAGRMCSTDQTGYDFGSKYTFSGVDLPSGQDTFTMKVDTADGKSYEFTSSPGFVFVTHPMLVSYDTGAGKQQVAYGQPSVSIGITQSTTLTLEMYRPQRLAIDGESGDYYDLGGFKVSPDIPNGIAQGSPGQPGQPGQPSQGPGKCDPQMVTDTAMTSDTPIDTVAKPTMTIRWKIGDCFTQKSVAWSVGRLTVDIQVEPSGPGGNSAQKLFLTTS